MASYVDKAELIRLCNEATSQDNGWHGVVTRPALIALIEQIPAVKNMPKGKMTALNVAITQKIFDINMRINECNKSMDDSFQAQDFTMYAFHKGQKTAYEDVLKDLERWVNND